MKIHLAVPPSCCQTVKLSLPAKVEAEATKSKDLKPELEFPKIEDPDMLPLIVGVGSLSADLGGRVGWFQ